MSNEVMHPVELTAEELKYLRTLVSGDVADRTIELHRLRDPNDADRFSNMRADAEKARNTGLEILKKLLPNSEPGSDVLDIPLFLRRNQVK